MKRKILVTLLAFCLIASLCVVGAAASEAPAATADGLTPETAFTTPDAYRSAITGADAQSKWGGKDIYLTIIGTEEEPKSFGVGDFNLGNPQSWADPPKLHLKLQYCNFTGNTSGDSRNTSFMYLPNCKELVIDNCKFDAGEGLKYGINWNLIQVQDATVSITNSSFSGTYVKNAIKLNQRNGADDTASDVKVDGDTIPASIAYAMIDNCEFDGTNAIIAIGSQGKFKPDDDKSGLASPSTGAFPVSITKTEATVKLDYLAAEDAEEVPTETASASEPYIQTATSKIEETGDYVARIGNAYFEDLQAAIEAAEDGETVTLVANVDEDIAAGTPLKVVEKDITIEGRSKTISLTLTSSTVSNGRDKILQVQGENAKLTLNNVTLDIDGFENTANENRACGDAIDLYLGGDLEANNSTIDIDNVAAAFVIQTAGETIVLNNTTVTADNVRGNGSQGGSWSLNNSSISFTNCGDHGLSVETIKATNSTITVHDADLMALFASKIDLDNSTVNVTNSGSELPVTDGYAETLGGYHSPVQVKGVTSGSYLNVGTGSTINISGSINGNNTVYLPDGAELINNGTINATVTVPEDSDMCVVVFMADGAQYDVQVVDSGKSVRVPTLSKSGYTFTGWRVNNSNTIVKGGESYPITANTTFTAVWNMIMIPDTYDIAVDQPAHGTVDVSFSNASQGSVITVTATPDEGYELVYITVDGEPISGNSFVMPDHAVEVSALFAEIGKEVNFVDVSRADWFYDYVQYVAQNGLMEGTTRTAFEPNASMTRAMFWTVLARIDGETITGDAWKTLAQTWAVESGISDGTNADALITREQMVTMLYRYAGSPVAGGMAISEFTDGASVSDYATDAVTWALSEGILTGMGDGILAPQGTATRAQAAAMLMRFVEA